MALPTLLKTWQIVPNITIVSQDEDTFHPEVLWQIKDTLTSFASNPWTVVASSDGTTADGTDRWASVSDVNWGTAAHSWIVLQNASGFQILFDPDYSGINNPEDMNIKCSPGGNFTGFTSTSVVPTASDLDTMQTGLTTGWFGDLVGTIAQHQMHIWHSSDGTDTRIAGYRSNVCYTFMFVGDIVDAAAGHTEPIAYGWQSSTTERVTVSLWEDFNVFRTTHSGTSYQLRCTGEDFSGTNLMENTFIHNQPDDISGEYALSEIGYACVTVGARGSRGKMADVFWGPYVIAQDGDTFPNDANNRQFVQIGHVVLPWTGDSTACETA